MSNFHGIDLINKRTSLVFQVENGKQIELRAFAYMDWVTYDVKFSDPPGLSVSYQQARCFSNIMPCWPGPGGNIRLHNTFSAEHRTPTQIKLLQRVFFGILQQEKSAGFQNVLTVFDTQGFLASWELPTLGFHRDYVPLCIMRSSAANGYDILRALAYYYHLHANGHPVSLYQCWFFVMVQTGQFGGGHTFVDFYLNKKIVGSMLLTRDPDHWYPQWSGFPYVYEGISTLLSNFVPSVEKNTTPWHLLASSLATLSPKSSSELREAIDLAKTELASDGDALRKLLENVDVQPIGAILGAAVSPSNA